MTNDDIDDIEQLLDHLCYYVLAEINDWYPPAETAEECIESHLEAKTRSPTERKRIRAFEHGYHSAGFTNAEALTAWLTAKGVDVVGRADRHCKNHGLEEITLDSEDVRVFREGFEGSWLPES